MGMRHAAVVAGLALATVTPASASLLIAAGGGGGAGLVQAGQPGQATTLGSNGGSQGGSGGSGGSGGYGPESNGGGGAGYNSAGGQGVGSNSGAGGGTQPAFDGGLGSYNKHPQQFLVTNSGGFGGGGGGGSTGGGGGGGYSGGGGGSNLSGSFEGGGGGSFINASFTGVSIISGANGSLAVDGGMDGYATINGIVISLNDFQPSDVFYTVHDSGYYTITAAGAQGGRGGVRGSDDIGGFGALVTGTTYLTAGSTLDFIIGQGGSSLLANSEMLAGGGGGGGTFVELVSTVPLPASAPMFGAALLALGAVGYGVKRKKAVATV